MSEYWDRAKRQQFLDQIKSQPFRSIKSKLSHVDQKSRLAYWRNAQASGKLMTRYVLPTYGTVVTLIEEYKQTAKHNAEYDLVEIVVEPTADNAT